ncbi:putative ribonuclease H-like domain-containing protein [Tanacetum coccineum]
MTHPHPNRKFVPQAVLTRFGKINTASASVNTTVRPVNTAGSKTTSNPQQKEFKEKGVIDSGFSRHMTGNTCYLTEYEDYDGGFELKYNLFSVSQICDKNNNVLFTDTECLVLSSDFKLLDESQVLLRVPKKDNIYSVDLKSVVPTKGLTCLFAKATIDESNLWHRRFGHINFKNMKKLVRGNLVRGLPSKIFENDHSCVACQKGKQHKASYKAKLMNFIRKPLHMLHMDLLGPTNVKSLMKTSYCLGIKREFSVARTPQQNGVAERRNRTLIEAARTMDHLGKFDGKADEGFFVVYSMVSKAMRVFNKRTQDSASVIEIKLMIARTRDNIVTGQAEKKTKHEQEYILIPICTTDPLISQVTPKMSHIHAVKRIFRYLKGQPKLGLWYPRDSPFDLEAFSDSDYAGASLDRKSTTGGCQFLGKRLISWQCKKQTIVANSTTKAEYVAAANCCRQVLWIQNQMLDYGFNFMNTKIYIDNESTICIMKNPVFHSKTKHIEIRHHFIRDSYEKRLIQVIKIHTDHNVADLLTKAFDVSRFNFLVASIGLELKGYLINNRYADLFVKFGDFVILQSFTRWFHHDNNWSSITPSLTDKKELAMPGQTRLVKGIISNFVDCWNDLLFNDDDGITCLTNDDIFENLALMRNLDSKKFLMYPRFLQLNQLKDLPEPFNDTYDTPSHTKKVFSNMARQSKEPQTALLKTETPQTVSYEPQTEAHIEKILPSLSTYHRKHRKTQKHRRAKKVTELPQTSVPLDLGADKAVYKEGSDSGSPRRQETMGGALAQTRSKRVLEKPNEPPLPESHTSGSEEGSMEHTFELMDTVPPTPHDSPLTGGYTPRSDEGRLKLKELMAMCTKLSKQVLNLKKEKDAQAGRISEKTKPMFKDSDFDDLDDLVDEGMAFVQEKDAKNQGVSTAGEGVSTAGEGVSTATPRAPPTTTTIFDDEDVTMAMVQTLIKTKEEKAKVKGVAIKDVEDSSRAIKTKTNTSTSSHY